MKIKKIRIKGQKLTLAELKTICKKLEDEILASGFITNVKIENSQAITLGLHMKSFIINTKMKGYNKRVDSNCKKGYKKTSLPTYDQRVEYNELINKVLDAYDVKADIISGAYTVRSSAVGAYSNEDWSLIATSHDINTVQKLNEWD